MTPNRASTRLVRLMLVLSVVVVLIQQGISGATATGVGDLNSDGRTDSIDAALVLQFAAGLLPSATHGDVNDDGQVNSIDAALILQFNAGLLGRLPGKPLPAPGTVLYDADWSTGRAGWLSAYGWTWLDGMLVNDASNSSEENAIFAPYQPGDAGIDDYAVEAEIQFIDTDHICASFGIVSRGAYQGGMGLDAGGCNGWGMGIWLFGSSCLASCLDHVSFQYGADWRTVRLEVDGNTLRLIVDGAELIEVQDNRFLDGDRVGLWSENSQISVRSFKVIAL